MTTTSSKGFQVYHIQLKQSKESSLRNHFPLPSVSGLVVLGLGKLHNSIAWVNISDWIVLCSELCFHHQSKPNNRMSLGGKQRRKAPYFDTKHITDSNDCSQPTCAMSLKMLELRLFTLSLLIHSSLCLYVTQPIGCFVFSQVAASSISIKVQCGFLDFFVSVVWSVGRCR